LELNSLALALRTNKVMNEAENEWDQITATNWKGLGLNDPIKKVEVGQNLHSGYSMYSKVKTKG
jgi:hypothetical protein